jgi:hypothetical protein
MSQRESSKSSKIPSFEHLRKSGMSLSMGPQAREVGFGLMINSVHICFELRRRNPGSLFESKKLEKYSK